MSDRHAALAAFLRDAARRPFVYGEWDCAMLLANWVRSMTGVDPAPELRGAYGTETGWKRLVVAAGGLEPLVGRIALSAGLSQVEMASAGDVGIVIVPDVGEAGGIRTASRWAVKLDVGLVAADFAPVAAWGWDR